MPTPTGSLCRSGRAGGAEEATCGWQPHAMELSAAGTQPSGSANSTSSVRIFGWSVKSSSITEDMSACALLPRTLISFGITLPSP